ncbi:dihydrodipicolinate synthase family protein [Escherichia coli]|nr:dihydrodipicolinate synthase family protein [Escherichia coli]
MVCVVGRIRDLILQLSKSSIYSTKPVLETVAEEAGGKLTLIAHVGAISTRDSQLLARAAVKYGFDAISAVTPFYYPFSFG